MKPRNSALSCLALLWLASTAFGADFHAKVIHIADGDTITVLNDAKEQIKIRLNGIDSPEKAQAFGNKAKQFTKELVAGQPVIIQAYGQDKYGRTIGDVILDDGRSLSQELVKAGYAWWYRKYAPGDTVLKTLEAEAREAQAGLWNDPHPIPPWDFRHRGARTPIKPGPSSASSPKVGSHSDSFDSLPVVGNLRSGKYHRPDCPSYDQIAKKNRVPFGSAQDARGAGYALAGNCPR
jgi:endonuclease YncB( thermonuclease family)